MPEPEHDCPGGCGVKVAYRRLACPSCWYLLPQPMRQAVQRGGQNRLTAVSEALTWYRNYLREGDQR